MWGVPETLLLQECCECPEAHTLKCRGREPAGWLPRALRDLPGGTSLDELARVRVGSWAASGSATTLQVEGTKSSKRQIHVSQNATLLICNKKLTQADGHAYVCPSSLVFLYTSHMGSQIIIRVLGNVNQSKRNLS